MLAQQAQQQTAAITNAIQAAAAAAPAAAPVAAAALGNRKITPFESGTAADWDTWVSNFRIHVQLGGWTHQRARRELGVAMTGAAKQSTKHIELGDAIPAGQADCDDWELLKAQYDAIFMPPGASEFAKEEFDAARQAETDTIDQWHGHLRFLYQRAYPTRDAAFRDNCRDLQARFIDGLANPGVAANLRMLRDTQLAVTYTQLRDLAYKAQTTHHANTRADRGNGAKAGAFAMGAEPAISAAGRYSRGSARYGGQPRTGTTGKGCWNCGDPRHQARNCRKPGEQNRGGSSRGRGGNPRGRGRGWSNGGGYRGGQRAAPYFKKQRIAALCAELEELTGQESVNEDQYEELSGNE